MFNGIATAHGDGTIFNNVVYSDSLRFPQGYQFHLDFFGLDLSKTLFTVGTDNIIPLIIMVLIIAATFAAQYISIKLTNPQGTTKTDKNIKKIQEIDVSETGKNKKKHLKPNQPAVSSELKDPVDKQIAASPQQLQFFLTIFILFISIMSAAALSIYWCARSVFVIILTLIQKKYILKEK